MPLLQRFSTVYWKRVETMRGKQPGPFNWPTLRPRIARGECVALGPANVVQALKDPDDTRVEMMVDTAPLDVLSRLPGHDPARDTPLLHYRYDFSLAVGSLYLAPSGAVDTLVDAVFRFACETVVQVGAVAAEPTHAAAIAIASHGGGDPGSDLERRARPIAIARHTWGPKARAPEWGTFIKRAHVDAIGGVEAIRVAAEPHRLLEHDDLIYVQLTSYQDALAPICAQRLGRLDALMTPVLS